MPENQNLAEDNTPISYAGYLGYLLLFMIPCVGLIAMIVFAFNKNVNVKNFARAYLTITIIVAVIVIIAMVVIGSALYPIIMDLLDFLKLVGIIQ